MALHFKDDSFEESTDFRPGQRLKPESFTTKTTKTTKKEDEQAPFRVPEARGSGGFASDRGVWKKTYYEAVPFRALRGIENVEGGVVSGAGAPAALDRMISRSS